MSKQVKKLVKYTTKILFIATSNAIEESELADLCQVF